DHAAAPLAPCCHVPCCQEIIPDLEQITAAAEQAAEIIRRLRKMTGKRLARRSSVDLNKLVQEAASLLVSDALANNVWLSLDLAPDLPLVLADSVLTQQVILNLARNAIEAMSATGGTALEQWHERELIIRTSAAGGDAVEAAVCDTGPVLPAEVKDRLFEPFFTTKPEGMGLGLSISQAIIQANGGRLLAASNPERGMTFRFTLPVSQPRRHPVASAPGSDKEPGR
ncbi:MAG: ATP-binding protein, partial [Planctomycetota bacterium]